MVQVESALAEKILIGLLVGGVCLGEAEEAPGPGGQ